MSTASDIAGYAVGGLAGLISLIIIIVVAVRQKDYNPWKSKITNSEDWSMEPLAGSGASIRPVLYNTQKFA